MCGMSPAPVPPGTAPATPTDARRSTLAALAGERFDVLVMGGGITGAGVAREAALAGLRVALVERSDFASGTSSRSSRLVHGGVRYLEHGHVGLVFESSRERRLLLALAPHLVRPLAFTWPVYRGARVPRWKVRAGLLLYDALALFRNVHRHEGLSRQQVLDAEPALDPDGLRGGARYWDASTDDSRLTLANALSAQDAGAVVCNHVQVTGGIHEGARLAGVTALDVRTGDAFSIRARVVINATGPWSDATAALTGGDVPATTRSQLRGSAGAHVSVPRHRLGNRDAITLVSPLDGRVMFVLPAGAHAIIGTTEGPAGRGPDEIRATVQDVQYLLQSVNRCFPFARLTTDDVLSAWCGIRPLAAARAGEQHANAASREHAIAMRADGLVSMTGGKLTTYRAMAADVLSAAARHHGLVLHPHTRARSEQTPLHGGELSSLAHAVAEAGAVAHDSAVGERLVHAYGNRWREVWSAVSSDATLGTRLSDQLPYLLGEVTHAVRYELACTLADVLVRRTHLAFETRDHGRAAARRIAPRMQLLLGWSDEQVTREIAAYDSEVARLFTIDEHP
jgi:glycerol-3-phosphate dehydrogenase